MRGIRYYSVDEIPASPWLMQGTVYTSLNDAKYAAAKLFALCDNTGVFVKHVQEGWTLLFWRKQGVIK